jgi:deazaflavin-dependent oxidoreductase (nitroreductase family)
MKSNEELLPRPGSPLYKLNHQDESKRKKMLRRWRILNKYLVLPLYRLRIFPLFGFGRIFLILTTKGRKTGKKRRTPLEYHRIDQIITVFSSRGEEAGWVKNILANPNHILVRHGFHRFQPQVEFISEENQKLEIIKWYVINHGKAAKMLFGWDRKRDDPETTDFSKMLELLSIIRFNRKMN